ncbi:ATP-binding cassette domain-containing protein [Nocardia sp. NPDC050175]|uniref:ATP-binding cassette domain-containing protein n=1 Tax=Nocardia sp. NPDC050175 TaxID=3364317 RepID=UPI00379C6591
MIEASGLAKTFKTRGKEINAVRGVDFAVEAGESVGFLGPNGAGKTTTLRMLTTLLRPTAGSAKVAGCDLLSDPIGVRRRIGYVAQEGGTTPECKVHEELEIQGRFYRLTVDEVRQRIDELLVGLDLAGLENRYVKTLSGGQRRRLQIALGLIHQPPVLFLDEPSAGLDPQSRANLWDHIRALRDRDGVTTFLTTHYLEEADALCDKVLVIDHGKLIAEGSPDALKASIAGDEVTIGVDPTARDRARELIIDIAGPIELTLDERAVRARLPHGDTAIPDLVRKFDSAGIAIRNIEVRKPTLDDVFLTLTGRTLRDAEIGEIVEEEKSDVA